MISLFYVLSLRHFLQQKLKTCLTLFGVSLGVGTVVAIAIVNQSVLQSFQESVNHIAGRASLQVTAGQIGFPEKIVDLVQGVQGVEHAVPVIEASGLMQDAKERSLQILAVDVLQDYHLRQYDLDRGNADIPDPLLFLARPDSILISRQVAEREGLELDSILTLQTIGGKQTFRVRGILEMTGPARAFGGNLAVMDIFAAQRMFGKEGRIDRIDVSLFPESDRGGVKQAIAAVLPEGYRIDSPASRTQQVELLLQSFQTMLGFVAATALLVGMYLIYNAVLITVAQRRHEIGLLRLLGARRFQVLLLLFVEVAGTALLGSIAGMVVGIFFGRGVLLGIVSKTVSQIYVNVISDVFVLPWRHMVLAAATGIGSSLIAATWPVREALKIPPQSVIRTLPVVEDCFSSFRRSFLLSVSLIVTSGLFYFLVRYPAFVTFKQEGNYLSVFFFVVGISLLTPSFLYLLLYLIRRLRDGQAGILTHLAAFSLQKRLGRNAMAAGAILFSIAIFVATSGFIESMKRSMLDSFVYSVGADIYVTDGHPFASRGGQNIPLPEEFGEEIKAIPGVLSVDPFRMISVEYSGIQHLLKSVDVALWRSHSRLKMADGPPEIFQTGEETCLISEGFANLHHIRRGDIIHLPTPKGIARFRVSGIAIDYTSDTGSVMLNRHLYKKYWGDNLVDTFSIRVKPGIDPGAVRTAILDRFGRERRLFVLLNREFVSAVVRVLDQPMAAMTALEAVALMVGAGGIIVALLSAVAERTREIGMLRGLGMTRREVARMIVFEAGFLGLTGGIFGSLTGFVISWTLLNGIVRSMFGASVLFDPPWFSILIALIGSTLLAALAGFYPARLAARMNIVQALTYE